MYYHIYSLDHLQNRVLKYYTPVKPAELILQHLRLNLPRVALVDRHFIRNVVRVNNI